jgi:hypothetical protein
MVESGDPPNEWQALIDRSVDLPEEVLSSVVGIEGTEAQK